MTIYADLDGWKINVGTVPSDLVATGHWPDIVRLDKKNRKIVLLELTCLFNSCALQGQKDRPLRAARSGPGGAWLQDLQHVPGDGL